MGTVAANGEKPAINPALRKTGPGLALDGGAKFDLRRLNQQYFDQLRARVMEASQRGVYVSVVLFQSLSSSRKQNKTIPGMQIRSIAITTLTGSTATPTVMA